MRAAELGDEAGHEEGIEVSGAGEEEDDALVVESVKDIRTSDKWS